MLELLLSNEESFLEVHAARPTMLRRNVELEMVSVGWFVAVSARSAWSQLGIMRRGAALIGRKDGSIIEVIPGRGD